LEIDVAVSKDGEFVLFHDRNLIRLGRNTELCDLNLKQVKKQKPATIFFSEVFQFTKQNIDRLFKLNDSWVRKLSNSSIPSLEEVFSRFGKKVYYHLDLKSVACKQEKVSMIKKLVDLIAKHGLQRHLLIESQEPGLLSLIKTLNSSQLVLYWRDDIHLQNKSTLDTLRSLNFDAIDHFDGKLDENTVELFDQFYLFTYTINSYSRLAEVGRRYDFPITDLDAVAENPSAAHEFFNQQSQNVKILKSASDTQYKVLLAQGFKQIPTRKNGHLVLYRD